MIISHSVTSAGFSKSATLITCGTACIPSSSTRATSSAEKRTFVGLAALEVREGAFPIPWIELSLTTGLRHSMHPRIAPLSCRRGTHNDDLVLKPHALSYHETEI